MNAAPVITVQQGRMYRTLRRIVVNFDVDQWLMLLAAAAKIREARDSFERDAAHK